MSLGTESTRVRFLHTAVKTGDTVRADEERRVALATNWKGLSVYSPHTCHHLSLTHYFCAALALSWQTLALLQGNCSRASLGNLLRCSARDPNVLLWGCCERLAVWGTYLHLAETHRRAAAPSRAAPRPQASRCMGDIIVAVNSAAPQRPCLNRPLRMVHYGPCWLQLSRRADLCTLAWRWRDEKEWEKGD